MTVLGNVGVGDDVVISYCIDGKKAVKGRVVRDDGDRWAVEIQSEFLEDKKLFSYNLLVKKDSVFIKKQGL